MYEPQSKLFTEIIYLYLLIDICRLHANIVQATGYCT